MHSRLGIARYDHVSAIVEARAAAAPSTMAEPGSALADGTDILRSLSDGMVGRLTYLDGTSFLICRLVVHRDFLRAGRNYPCCLLLLTA